MTGDGSQGNPYTVATLADLDLVRNDLGATGALKYYIQTADIDMSGFGNFAEIAGSLYINYDGQGYSISGLSSDDYGMFGTLAEGRIYNINLDDCEVTTPTGSIDGGSILLRELGGSASIEDISITNSTLNWNTNLQAGIMVGLLTGNALNCYAKNCTINAADGTGRVGGFAGQMGFGSSANKCWASTEIVETGTVTGVGGFCGNASSGADQLNCFYDTDIGPAGNAGDATGKTTVELQTLATFTDTVNTVGLTEAYDMVLLGDYVAQTWKISEGQYPILGFEDYGTLIPSVTFKDETGTAIVGASAIWISETAFSASNPAWNSPAIVGSVYTTDANGVVTYDPNTDPAVDPAKVYTCILRDYNYVNGAWEKAQGSDTGQQNVDLTAP